jgi:hypothetical protein
VAVLPIQDIVTGKNPVRIRSGPWSGIDEDGRDYQRFGGIGIDGDALSMKTAGGAHMGTAVLAQRETTKVISLFIPAGHRNKLHRRVSRPPGYVLVNPVA